jgi:D-inositol-3-phosphate glycosyltransferase
MSHVARPEIEIGLLTGGRDRPYALGLVQALLSEGLRLDVVGSDELDGTEMHANSRLNFINICGNSRVDTSLVRKALRVLFYYSRLIPYAAVAKSKIFHILWNGKFEYFDRTLLMFYYKLLGKKVVLTLHNVNARKRDSNDSLLNRLTLKIQYSLADHIFVHSERMKSEVLQDFEVRLRDVTVIPFGINNACPCTNLTYTEAKRRLGLKEGERAILFFGNIGPYKGLEYLVAAFQRINARNGEYRLIIAGKRRGGAEKYVNKIREATSRDVDRGRVIQRIEYIPDPDIELYFKAADVLVLPYTYVYQSGVLFLGYSFGLPVIATDVGSLRDDIIEGETGFLCTPSDPVDLARIIEAYFNSELFKNLNSRRQKIRDYASERHSWNVVGKMTRNVYAGLLGRNGHETAGLDSDSRV